jgi:hypothetical protein
LSQACQEKLHHDFGMNFSFIHILLATFHAQQREYVERGGVSFHVVAPSGGRMIYF